ncbi:MAG: hypothetical protein K2X42_07980, partial [Burkholderiaceae bacterium]|nr:hypothetical protein [Burkholderiaceae bacterium]
DTPTDGEYRIAGTTVARLAPHHPPRGGFGGAFCANPSASAHRPPTVVGTASEPNPNRWSTANLRQAAQDAGIGAQRLVFAPRLPLAEHLARYRVADLAVDTYPYTSHTTASDALWCGCPLVALRGDTFAAGVSSSILTAAQLPALIAADLPRYEARIIQLASHAELRRDLGRRLEAAKTTAPLFDTTALTRALETLYIDIHTQTSRT